MFMKMVRFVSGFERMDSNLRIHVYNDGKCIPEEELNKLWIKFYKVDKARTREYGGNSIGLYYGGNDESTWKGFWCGE